MASKIRIGTSGWQVWDPDGTFYPQAAEGTRLQQYAGLLPVVELNRTFYRPVLPSTLAKWAGDTPRSFLFAVKAPKTISHLKRLRGTRADVEAFVDAMAPFGKKLGPVLFQLPPSFAPDYRRLGHFLRALPEGPRYTIEFRHPGWHTERTYAMLEAHRVAFCCFDIRGRESPRVATAPFTYTRLHGPLDLPYRGSYDEKSLASWAEQLLAWKGEGRDSFLFFDNTMGGAGANALRLQELIGPSRAGSARAPRRGRA